MKLYQRIAQTLEARQNCIRSGNAEWQDRHEEEIERLVKEYLPSGSGFDNGTALDFDRSSSEKLVFATSYHKMNDVGYYVGWIDLTITVKPSLAFDFHLRVTGGDSELKDYVHQVFYDSLKTEC